MDGQGFQGYRHGRRRSCHRVPKTTSVSCCFARPSYFNRSAISALRCDLTHRPLACCNVSLEPRSHFVQVSLAKCIMYSAAHIDSTNALVAVGSEKANTRGSTECDYRLAASYRDCSDFCFVYPHTLPDLAPCCKWALSLCTTFFPKANKLPTVPNQATEADLAPGTISIFEGLYFPHLCEALAGPAISLILPSHVCPHALAGPSETL